MKARIRRCPEDGTYTLHLNCPVCGAMTRSAHPPRFSPQDRFWKYRISQVEPSKISR